jgi:hypothetical protein
LRYIAFEVVAVFVTGPSGNGEIPETSKASVEA